MALGLQREAIVLELRLRCGKTKTVILFIYSITIRGNG